jgi:sigma-B regulation protein RsbU (phosphoserine phosphatase)
MTFQGTVEAPSDGRMYADEREEARQIQLSLLPERGLKETIFEIAYRYSPFAEVGGDFADFFNLPDGRAGLYVGDVVGKGLPAAMYATLVMGMLRGIHKTGQGTADALALLNRRLLVRPVKGRYSAMIYAVFDPASGKLSFSNAGLPYPLLVSKSGCRALGQGGVPTGLLPDSSYEPCSVQLSPGDAVLFATDGLHELRDGDDRDFSWDRLAEIWQQCGCKSAEESLDFLFEEAKGFSEGDSQKDDITAVVLKVHPVAAGAALGCRLASSF